MSLPISVVIPLSDKPERQEFFFSKSLPSIVENDPAQIIMWSEGENANVKRNTGAKDAKEPYLFFCDDDIILKRNCLQRMYETLEANPNKGYAYCMWEGKNHPCNGDFIHKAAEFSAEKLRRENYISTMSLIRRYMFPVFDASLLRLQDWDLWLTMLEQGHEGIYIPEILFTAYYQKDGITQKAGYKEAAQIVRQKHGL